MQVYLGLQLKIIFNFTPQFLGNKTEGHFITLSDWINAANIEKSSSKILQMDIEGSEYEVLTYENLETLSSFSLMVIEFHGLENIFERYFLMMISSILKNFAKAFQFAMFTQITVAELRSIKE